MSERRQTRFRVHWGDTLALLGSSAALVAVVAALFYGYSL